MEITISIKWLFIVIGAIVTIACVIWGYINTEKGGQLATLGCIFPTLVWFISIIVLLIYWIIFIK